MVLVRKGIIMCVILVKEKNDEMPDHEILEKCFSDSPDGVGVAWWNGEELCYKKGIMTLDNLYSFLDRKDFTNYGLVIHFRHGSDGKNSKEFMTHPFVVGEDNKLEGTFCDDTRLLLVNGTFENNDIGDYDNLTQSDTLILSKKFVTELYNNINSDIIASFRDGYLLGTMPRILVLNKNGIVQKYGQVCDNKNCDTDKCRKWHKHKEYVLSRCPRTLGL